jgi:hypothetical protein
MQKCHITEMHFKYLQNMQDCRNSLNSHRLDDPLERLTIPLDDPNIKTTSKEHKKELQAEICTHMYEKLTQLVGLALQSVLTLEDHEDDKFADTHINLDILRNRGHYGCANAKNVPALSILLDQTSSVIDIDLTTTSHDIDSTTSSKSTPIIPPIIPIHSNNCPTLDKLITLNVHSIRRNILADNGMNVTNFKEVVCATGSIPSIQMWARYAFGNDHKQQQAFQTIVADFVISMLNKAKLDPGIQRQEQHSILTMSSDLYRLRGLQTRYYYQEMRMFLTGGGGSGKTHVIKQQVLIYCKAFCQECNVPFHKRTITVTALTGVAAIALNGKTLHKGCGINVDLSISKVWLYSDLEIQIWKARLLFANN